MPATFSVNIGTQLEASSKADILSVLKDLPDNTHRLISPRDVRDAFLSTWSNSPFKQTTNISGIEYIGIDSGNPANRDIKEKILIGKRNYGNLDILNTNLLNSNTDIFFYNTKPDNITQSSTKVAFLAGTNSNLHYYAPYIESKQNDDSISLNFRNPSGDSGPINIWSNTGRVAINGILFPTLAENQSSATNGKILRYFGTFPNGYLKWDDTNITVAKIGTPGRQTDIYGETVNLNGYELEFVSNSLVPNTVGGIPSGFSFSATSFNGGKWPITEVIRKLLYPYTPPKLSITAINRLTGTKYAEINTAPTIDVNWDMTIYPRTNSEYVSNYFIRRKIGAIETATSYYGMSFSGLPGKTFSGTASFIETLQTSPTQSYYLLNISDVPNIATASFPFGWTHSATASIEYVYPIYYGFSNTKIIDFATFNSVYPTLNKYISPYPGLSSSVSLNYSGSGYLYFIHHNAFQTSISMIKDPNGYIIHDYNDYFYSAFGATTNGNIISGYNIWSTSGTCSYTGTGKFEFKF
jgi:hypothetical protein